jgi:hypothetical protein
LDAYLPAASSCRIIVNWPLLQSIGPIERCMRELGGMQALVVGAFVLFLEILSRLINFKVNSLIETRNNKNHGFFIL